MYQTVGHMGIEMYAQAMDLPLFREETSGKTSQGASKAYEPDECDEVEDLYRLLSKIKVSHTKTLKFLFCSHFIWISGKHWVRWRLLWLHPVWLSKDSLWKCLCSTQSQMFLLLVSQRPGWAAAGNGRFEARRHSDQSCMFGSQLCRSSGKEHQRSSRSFDDLVW